MFLFRVTKFHKVNTLHPSKQQDGYEQNVFSVGNFTFKKS